MEPGRKIYSVAVSFSAVTLLELALGAGEAKRMAAITKEVPPLCAYPMGDATLYFYGSRNAAKMARNVLADHGIDCGNNICEWTVGKDGVPEFTEKLPDDWRPSDAD